MTLSNSWILSLLAAVLLPGCDALNRMLPEARPTARIVNVSLRDLTLQDVSLAFEVEVRNPYDVDLPVARLDYAIARGGTSLLTGASETQGLIPSRSSKALPVTATLSFASLLQLVQDVRPGAVLPYEAELGVSVDAPVVGRLRLPVRHEGEVPVPALPGVTVSGLAFETLGLQEARGVLRLAIRNTNDFPLSLRTVRYDLSLAGQKVAASTLQRALTFEPGADRPLEIPVTFRPVEFGLAAFQALTGTNSTFQLAGTLAVDTPFGPLGLPLDERGTVALTH